MNEKENIDPIFPWFQNTWQQLLLYKKNNILPSGIFFSGPEGLGQLTLAKEFSKMMLCQASSDAACLACRACVLFQAGTHPDFFLIQPEEKSTSIKIEQIRQLTDSLVHTSVLNKCQIALISLAEEMNKAAANALLKTLEEPRGHVLIILISHQPSAVPATILSRCQHIKLPLADAVLAEQWLTAKLGTQATTSLRIADNLPFRALELTSEKISLRDKMFTFLCEVRGGRLDPVQAAAQCLDLPLERLQFLMTLTMDMLRVRFLAEKFVNHQDKLMPLKELCCNVSTAKLFDFLDKILQATAIIKSRSNANLQLLMEKIFIYWRYNDDVN